MSNQELIEYWVTVVDYDIGLKDWNATVKWLGELGETLIINEYPNKQGVIMFSVQTDWNGDDYIAEHLMYIKPEYRGSVSMFKKAIKAFEEAAKYYGCKYIILAADIGYRDDKFLSLFQKLGYKPESIRKNL